MARNEENSRGGVCLQQAPAIRLGLCNLEWRDGRGRTFKRLVLREELSSLFSTGKELGTLHSQHLAWTMEVLPGSGREGVQRMRKQPPWAGTFFLGPEAQENWWWLVVAHKNTPWEGSQLSGKMNLSGLGCRPTLAIWWHWHMNWGLNRSEDLRPPHWGWL